MEVSIRLLLCQLFFTLHLFMSDQRATLSTSCFGVHVATKSSPLLPCLHITTCVVCLQQFKNNIPS